MNFGIKQLGWGRQSSGHAGLTVSFHETTRRLRPCSSTDMVQVRGHPNATAGLCVARLSLGTATGPHMHPTLSCH